MHRLCDRPLVPQRALQRLKDNSTVHPLHDQNTFDNLFSICRCHQNTPSRASFRNTCTFCAKKENIYESAEITKQAIPHHTETFDRTTIPAFSYCNPAAMGRVFHSRFNVNSANLIASKTRHILSCTSSYLIK